jgi:hypothetical protein
LLEILVELFEILIAIKKNYIEEDPGATILDEPSSLWVRETLNKPTNKDEKYNLEDNIKHKINDKYMFL